MTIPDKCPDCGAEINSAVGSYYGSHIFMCGRVWGSRVGWASAAAACLERQLAAMKALKEKAEAEGGRRDALWNVCRKFIDRLDIWCGETVYQTDRVGEAALELIEDVCDIVGYKPSEDDDPTSEKGNP
jgi:hypothetical protein